MKYANTKAIETCTLVQIITGLHRSNRSNTCFQDRMYESKYHIPIMLHHFAWSGIYYKLIHWVISAILLSYNNIGFNSN